MDQDNLSRRTFIKNTAAGAAAASAAASLLSNPAPAKAFGAADRLRIGFIGPGGRGFGAHVKTLAKLRKEGANIDLVAVSEVYSAQRDQVCGYIKEQTGTDPKKYDDYNDMLADKDVDAVCIATPDHWHAKQTIDAMKAGKHVYCEKPMTHTVEEAMNVVDAWRSTGKIMQVGVQSTSLPLWTTVNELINDGKLGKVLMYQTEYFRNSIMGQWRYYELSKEMTPKTIDWQRWLGVKEGLAPEMPFDRALYAQWRCYWPFGMGMYTDLFVHRTTSMLKATGLRFPRRVVGAGGIFLEYDGRDVPDVATVVADFDEGVQGLVTATMCCEATPIRQLIRGHYGSFEFGNGESFAHFDFIPERPQVTKLSGVKKEKINTGAVGDTTVAHFKNWLDAIRENKQEQCNNTPELGAAAIVLVNLGAQSYREGKAFFWDKESRQPALADASWAANWEQMSKERAKPHHVPGWKAGDKGSLLVEPDYMKLAGPWTGDKDPAEGKG